MADFDKYVTQPMVWLAGDDLAQAAFLGFGPGKAATGENLSLHYKTDFAKAADKLGLPKLKDVSKPLSTLPTTVQSLCSLLRSPTAPAARVL